MRIPYGINRSTLSTYYPSAQSLELIGECLRKLLSEDFTEWDKDICPSLKDFCVQAISKTFERNPLLEELPCADKDYLIEILSVELPLELCIPYIEYEYYWKRRYSEKFGVCTRAKPNNWTWKSLYIERHVQYMLENAQPQYNDEETMVELLALCNSYVKKVIVTQLLSWEPPLGMEKEDIPEVYPEAHINFVPIFNQLPDMEEFDLIVGRNDVGESFTWRMLHVAVADCKSLGKAIENSKNLKILKLHRSFVDDTHTQTLMQGLINNTTIQELDLSNCRIRDPGALCIAKVLGLHPRLRILNLCNNLIEKKGAEAIAFSLLSETVAPLRRLILRLNPLRHDGCLAIMRAMVRSNRPEELNMSACGFEQETGARLAQMVKLNKCIVKLDVSNNWIDEDDGEKLIDALMINRLIHWLDVRDTDMTKEQQKHIKRLLIRNRTGEEEFSDSEVEIVDEEESEDEDTTTMEEEKSMRQVTIAEP